MNTIPQPEALSQPANPLIAVVQEFSDLLRPSDLPGYDGFVDRLYLSAGTPDAHYGIRYRVSAVKASEQSPSQVWIDQHVTGPSRRYVVPEFGWYCFDYGEAGPEGITRQVLYVLREGQVFRQPDGKYVIESELEVCPPEVVEQVASELRVALNNRRLDNYRRGLYAIEDGRARRRRGFLGRLGLRR